MTTAHTDDARLVRIEEKLDSALQTLPVHEERIKQLEQKEASMSARIWAIVVIFVGFILTASYEWIKSKLCGTS